MEFETISLLVGNRVCNAKCPFCIAQMTNKAGYDNRDDGTINVRNLHKALQYAVNCNVNNVIITSLGEPTVYPNDVETYLKEIQSFRLPIIELQTNGYLFEKKEETYFTKLRQWYEYGLDIISISTVHYDNEINRQCYFPHLKRYINLENIISNLKKLGFTVRLNATLVKGWIDSVAQTKILIEYAKNLGADQLTMRPVAISPENDDFQVRQWTIEHSLPDTVICEIQSYYASAGTLLLEKKYGAKVYDYHGFNVCLSNCFGIDKFTNNTRQLIFHQTGKLTFDWHYSAVILSGM